MMKALDIAKYFLDKDPERRYFTYIPITRNGLTFYDGNAKINKFLHLAQVLYIAKYGKLLMEDVFYAFANGAVVEDVQKAFNSTLHKPTEYGVSFDTETNDFLDRVYFMLQNASVDDLIDLSHEDDEWDMKNIQRKKAEQQMDFMPHIDTYKKQYADALSYIYKAV